MITHKELIERFHYDPETGIFTRRKSIKGINADRPVGTKKITGYIETRIQYQHYRLHRLAWMYMTGHWPERFIDHINRDKSDNRWVNLREAGYQENGRNRTKSERNTSGAKGVTFHKQTGKWQAQLGYLGSIKYLGLFDNKEDAKGAYNMAAKQLHKEFFCE